MSGSEKNGMNIMTVVYEKLPTWAWILIAVGAGVSVAVIVIAVVYCVMKIKKKKSKMFQSSKKSGAKVDTKAVKALGQFYKEKVQPDLEDLKVGCRSNEEDAGLGRIHYSLDYNFKNNEVIISMLECVNLPAMDSGNTSDPFVKFCLNPDFKSYETKVVEKSLNPTFNEEFTIKIAYSELITKTLVIEVYDFDRLSQHDQIGKVSLPINTVDLGMVLDRWSYIQIADSKTSNLPRPGDLCFSLKYVPTAGKMTVVVIEAKNLRKMDKFGLSDPFVKMSLMIGTKLIKRKKTSVKKKTLNPYYNESFTFEVPFEDIQKISVLLEVVDYDLISKSDVIGQVYLGCNTIGQSLMHWSEMLANPRRAIAQWHTLQEQPFTE